MTTYLHRDPLTRTMRQLDDSQLRAAVSAGSIRANPDPMAWQPYGPAVHADLVIAGLAEGVVLEWIEVPHPVFPDAPLLRSTGLVTLTDGVDVAAVRAVLMAHDCTAIDPHYGLDDDALEVARLDGWASHKALSPYYQRCALARVRDWLVQREGVKRTDPAVGELEAEAGRATPREANARAAIADARARITKRRGG